MLFIAKSAKQLTLYDLLFYIVIYSLSNGSKDPSEMTN